MRIKIKQKPDLIKVGSQSTSDIKIIKKIVGTSEVKKISVSFLLGIDVSECLSKNIQTGRFILSENKIDINETILDTPSLNQIINVDSKLKDAIIEKKTGVNFINETEKIFDITSVISNDDAKNRATYKSRITKISTDSTISLSDQFNYSGQQINFQVSKDVKAVCNDLLSVGVDPASLKVNFPIPSAEKMSIGNISKEDKLKQQYSRIISDPNSYSQGTFSSNFFPLEINLELSLEDENGKRNPLIDMLNYINIILDDASGKPIQKKIIKTNLVNEINEYIVSENNKSAKFYRRKIKKSLFSFNECKYEQPETFTVEDTSCDTILREVSEGILSKYEVTINKKNIRNIQITKPNTIIPFYLEQSNQSVIINCKDIPREVLSIGVEKRNISVREPFSRSNRSLSRIDVSGIEEIRFIDNDLDSNQTYEYRLYFVDKKGNFYVTSNSIIYYHPFETLESLAKIEITDPIVSMSGSNPILEFDIFGELTTKGTEYLKSFISNNGMTTQSSLGLSENNIGSYSGILQFEIVRQDIAFGLVESFGSFSVDQSGTLKFVDLSSIEKANGNSNILKYDPFKKYVYKVRLGLRNPLALDQEQINTTSITSGNNFKKFYNSPYKFNLTKGLIRRIQKDKGQQSLNESFDNFYFGVERVVSSPNVQSLISVTMNEDVIANRYRKLNEVSWEVSGNYIIIDHFRVYAIFDGVEAFIGSVPFEVSSTKYLYKDYDLYGRVGEVRYRVSAVLLNFEEVNFDQISTLVIPNNLPICFK